MCQTSLYIEKDGAEELLLEDVTQLAITEDGVSVATLFESPRELSGTVLRSIDFVAGRVLLEPAR